ncbi:MAG: hypothetical protein KatS3mg111_1966 [Pirellulaceae bacterium]|nr:MAG: hypothetical protein KatS3mg111_1966 [Pirellulaceae bacterium]
MASLRNRGANTEGGSFGHRSSDSAGEAVELCARDEIEWIIVCTLRYLMVRESETLLT